MKFADTKKRGKIDRDGLVSIYTRMFGAKCDELTSPEIEHRIKTFGRCECSKSCKEPFAGHCEFDHKFPNSVLGEGANIDWRALTKTCHARKTTKQDIPHIAKLKRTAAKYNPEYQEWDKLKPRKQKIQSRGFQSKKRPYVSNTKVID